MALLTSNLNTKLAKFSKEKKLHQSSPSSHKIFQGDKLTPVLPFFLRLWFYDTLTCVASPQVKTGTREAAFLRSLPCLVCVLIDGLRQERNGICTDLGIFLAQHLFIGNHFFVASLLVACIKLVLFRTSTSIFLLSPTIFYPKCNMHFEELMGDLTS